MEIRIWDFSVKKDFFCSFIFHSQTFSKKEKRIKKLLFYNTAVVEDTSHLSSQQLTDFHRLIDAPSLQHVRHPLQGLELRSLAAKRMAVIWNPNLYLRNLTPRIRPALDLLRSAISALPPGKEAGDVEHVLDLGCGPGDFNSHYFSLSNTRVHYSTCFCVLTFHQVTFLNSFVLTSHYVHNPHLSIT